MENKIKPTGSVQYLDENGNILNNLNLKNLQPRYEKVIEDILKFYKANFLENIHSIYLRGSVAKGAAIPNISDVDTIAISHTEIPKSELYEREYFWDDMNDKYPFVKGVEIHFDSIKKINNSKKLQFLYKTQCICIYGKDIKLDLPEFGLGEWAYAHSDNIEEGINRIKSWLKEDNTEDELKQICSWIMKRTVRIGFELVMKKEQCFTRDLYPCWELFSKHYPSKSEAMKEVLQLAVFPTSNVEQIWKVITSINDFLISEKEKNV